MDIMTGKEKNIIIDAIKADIRWAAYYQMKGTKRCAVEHYAAFVSLFKLAKELDIVSNDDKAKFEEDAKAFACDHMQKEFWYVETWFYDNGKVIVKRPRKVTNARKPSNKHKSFKDEDWYLDWFESETDANEFVNEAIEAEHAEVIG